MALPSSAPRALLTLRYSPIGRLANELVKSNMPQLWTRLRDTALEGHKPSRDRARPHRLRLSRVERPWQGAALYSSDPQKVRRAVHRLIGR